MQNSRQGRENSGWANCARWRRASSGRLAYPRLTGKEVWRAFLATWLRLRQARYQWSRADTQNRDRRVQLLVPPATQTPVRDQEVLGGLLRIFSCNVQTGLVLSQKKSLLRIEGKFALPADGRGSFSTQYLHWIEACCTNSRDEECGHRGRTKQNE